MIASSSGEEVALAAGLGSSVWACVAADNTTSDKAIKTQITLSLNFILSEAKNPATSTNSAVKHTKFLGVFSRKPPFLFTRSPWMFRFAQHDAAVNGFAGTGARLRPAFGRCLQWRQYPQWLLFADDCPSQIAATTNFFDFASHPDNHRECFLQRVSS